MSEQAQTDQQQSQQQQAAGQSQQQTQTDANALFKAAYERGETQAQKAFDTWLKQTFGTADRSELEKLAKKPDPKKPESDGLPQSVLDQIAALQKENESLKQQIQGSQLNAALHREVSSAGLKLHNDSITLKLLTDEYDFREINGELIAHRKGTDQPVIIDNRFATVKSLLTSWSKDTNYAFLFATGQRVGMPQSGQGGRMEKLKEGELANPDFVAALKRSGQIHLALTGQPFDRDKVEMFMPKTR